MMEYRFVIDTFCDKVVFYGLNTYVYKDKLIDYIPLTWFILNFY